jgi:hypothetical protein
MTQSGLWISGAVAVLFFAASVQTASAEQIINYSYTDNHGITYSGQMDGTLQADNNTFLVTALGPYTVDGNQGAALPFLESYDTLDFGSPNGYGNLNEAAVTLNGSYMDFAACTDDQCSAGYGMAVNDAITSITGMDFVTYTFLGEVDTGTFNANGSWNAQIVPEPGSVVLMSIALLAIALRRRKAII